jgi:hypothetical protein
MCSFDGPSLVINLGTVRETLEERATSGWGLVPLLVGRSTFALISQWKKKNRLDLVCTVVWLLKLEDIQSSGYTFSDFTPTTQW